MTQSPKLCLRAIPTPLKEQAPFSLRGSVLIAMPKGETCILLASNQMLLECHYSAQDLYWMVGTDNWLAGSCLGVVWLLSLWFDLQTNFLCK